MPCIQKDFENASHEAKSDAFDEFFLHLRLKDKVHGCEIFEFFCFDDGLHQTQTCTELILFGEYCVKNFFRLP
jgi:hypothetical protein